MDLNDDSKFPLRILFQSLVIFNDLTDINHRFVHKTPLHKLLNRWGKSNARIGGSESKRIEKLDTSLGRRAYPAFILNLSCQLSEYDITFEATKTYVEFKVLRFPQTFHRFAASLSIVAFISYLCGGLRADLTLSMSRIGHLYSRFWKKCSGQVGEMKRGKDKVGYDEFMTCSLCHFTCMEFTGKIVFLSLYRKVVVLTLLLETGPHASGKRKSECRSDWANESSLEMNLKSKRARIHTVDDDIIAAPLQPDSISMPQLGSSRVREYGIPGISESAGGEMVGSYPETGISGTSSWGQFAKPVLVQEKVGRRDPEISSTLFMDMGSALAHLIPDCPSPDMLCLGSPRMQAVSSPLSPTLSEESWDGAFNVCDRADDLSIEVSSAIDLNKDYGELQPAFQCLGSSISDIFQEMPQPLRAREPWISPPTTERGLGSTISLLGGEMNGWTSPALSPLLNIVLSPSPSISWSEREVEGFRRPSNVEDVAAESCSDVEEAQFHCELHKWSDRLGYPVHFLGQVGDCRSEVSQMRLSSGRMTFYLYNSNLF